MLIHLESRGSQGCPPSECETGRAIVTPTLHHMPIEILPEFLHLSIEYFVLAYIHYSQMYLLCYGLYYLKHFSSSSPLPVLSMELKLCLHLRHNLICWVYLFG